MAKKTDLQERVKRDCGDPSRFVVWGQQWGNDNYAASSRLAVAEGSSSSSFPATPEASSSEHDATPIPTNRGSLEFIDCEHEASPIDESASTGAGATHTQPALRHSLPAPFRSPLLPPPTFTAQTSGEATHRDDSPNYAQSMLSPHSQQQDAAAEGYDFTTQTGTGLEVTMHNSTCNPVGTPLLDAGSPSISNGSWPTYSANPPSTVDNAEGEGSSQTNAALPTGTGGLPSLATASPQDVELPPDAMSAEELEDVIADVLADIEYAAARNAQQQNAQARPGANFVPAVGQQFHAAVPSEPSAPAASQSANLQQPDGLLWAGAPEDDPVLQWLNLPDDFFLTIGATGAVQVPDVSGNDAFHPWSGSESYTESSQQDDSSIEQKDW